MTLSSLLGAIILDGPDGAGKTTLARALESYVKDTYSLATVYFYLSKSEEAYQQDIGMVYNIHEHVSKNKNLVVVDRHFIGESIYGSLYRNGSQYKTMARHIDRNLYRYPTLRVICAPSSDYVHRVHNELKQTREEMYSHGMRNVADYYSQLWSGEFTSLEIDRLIYERKADDYIAYLAANGGVKGRYGWELYDVETHGKNLESYCKYLCDSILDIGPKHYPFYTEESLNLSGKVTSRTNLIVIYNENDKDTNYPMTHSLVAEHMAQVHHQLKIDESRVAYINVARNDGPRMVRKYRPFAKKIICAGFNAAKALESERIDYHELCLDPILLFNNNQHGRRVASLAEISFVNSFSQAIGVSNAVTH